MWQGKANDVKHLPGRPKTDRLDAVWRCNVAEREMIRLSFRAAKLPQLQEAFVGHFTEHHRFLLTAMLQRIDTLQVDVTQVEAPIEAEIAPFA